MRAVRPRELPHQPRFPHAGLAHDGDGLSVSRGGAVERLSELLQLPLAPDKAGQAACGAGLEPRPGYDAPDQLVDFGWSVKALHGHRTKWSNLHEALGQAEGGAGDEGRAGLRHLLHPGGEMSRLAHGRVVHVEITADGAHDHIA
jgi:hypothetical protein